jgi:hypothetical protein
MSSGTGKKEFYDRIIGTKIVGTDGIETEAPRSINNELLEKKDRNANREKAINSRGHPPNPHAQRAFALAGGGVPAGAPETGVDVDSAGTSSSGEEFNIPGNPRGFSDELGNFVSIQGDGSLLLNHTSGAYVSIRPDGAVYVAAMGDKGINLVSGKGGIGIHSQGPLILDSQESIIMSAKGTIGINTVGGFPIQMNSGGDISMVAAQSMSRNIGASDLTSVGGSQSTSVFGDSNHQTQGKTWIGSTTQLMADSPITSIGASSRLVLNSEGVGNFYTKGNMQLQSKGMLAAMATSDMTLTSTKTLNLVGNEAASLDSPKNVAVRGKNVNLDAMEELQFDSADYLTLRAINMSLNAAQVLELVAGSSLKISSTGSLDIDATGAINLAGATIDLNSRAVATTPVDPAKVTSPRTAPDSAAVEDHYEDQQYESDNFYSNEQFESMFEDYKAKQQGFPYTSFALSEDEFNALKNNGGQLPPAAEEIANQKPTGGSAVSEGQSYGDRGSGAEYNESVAREPDIPPPTSSNPADPVGLSALRGIPGAEAVPGDGQSGASREEIYQNLLHLQENIRLPLLAEHPDVRTARGFILKYDNNDSNPHYKGLALDFIVANKRDLPRLVEVAHWASGNLPCKLVRIEKTKTYSYLHIEAAEAGQSGKSCKTETCSDIEGKNCQAGLPIKTYEYKDAEVSGRVKKGFYKGFD